MAYRSLIVGLYCLLATAAPGPGVTPTPTPPTSGITPIKNGKLITPLDANNFAITNLDLAGSGITGGGGGGGSGLASITGDDGTATGLTLAITHTTGSNLTDPVFTLGSTLSAAHGGTGFTSLSLLKSGLSLNLVDNTADADKPISDLTQDALDLKLAAADLAAFTGTTNIVTLGTIATGTWNATAIAAGKLPALNGITAPTADVSLNSHKITGLADPTGATDAANKQYADAVAAGGVPHPAVATASTNNRALTGEQTIDGVLTSTSRVLLKNQTASEENGIYVSAAGAWARAGDANADAEISGSVFVSGGTINAGTTWALTTPQPITLDTDALAYTQTGANTIYSATGGITLTGAQFSLSTMPTLTLKGNSTGSTAAPTDIAYATLKSGLSLNLVENTALSTWAGSSNITTLGTISTGTIPPARIQNITTVGTNFLNSLSTPGNASFVKVNTNGTLTERTFGETLSDISGQVALSVTSPLALTLAGGLSMPAATDLAAGHLSASDHTAFAAKVPPGRTITTTAPLRISTSTTPLSGAPGSDLSANRTIDIPAATDSVDGYLTKTDHQTFIGKSPPDSQVTFSNNGTTTSPATWTTGATAAYETAAITTADKFAFLPPSTSYSPGKRITYTDALTTASLGRYFRPATGSGDRINNLTSDYRPFIAGSQGPNGRKSIEFEACTASGGLFAGWQVVTPGSTIFTVEDPTDATKRVTMSAALQTAGTPGNITPANGASVTVAPNTYDSVSDLNTFVVDYDENGQAQRAAPVSELPDPSVNEGKVLGVVGGAWTAVAGSAGSPWVRLDETADPMVWHPVEGQRIQHAYAILPGDRELSVDSTNLESGMEFEFVAIQDGTGNRTLTGLPLGTLTGDAGAGLLPQTLTASAVDSYHLSYTGVGGIPWLASVRALDMTGAVVVLTCNTSGSTGAASGTNTLVSNNSATKYLASEFVATETSICRVDANLFRVGSPNYAMHFEIRADAARTGGVVADGLVTNGSPTVTSSTAAWTSADLGQHITGTGIPPNTYIGIVNSAVSIGLSNSKTTNSSVNASTVGAFESNVTLTTFGAPGALVGTGSTNDPSSLSVPTTLTGAGSADASPISFTGLAANFMTVGTTYHAVVWYSGTPDASNYIAWLYGGIINGYQVKKSAAASAWTQQLTNRKTRFTAYH